MNYFARFKPNSTGFTALMCLNILLLQFPSANCYTASGANLKELAGSLAKNFPNQFIGNVSVFDEFTYRIDPSFIYGFNRSVTRLEVIASVDGETSAQFPVFISLIQRHAAVSIHLPYRYRNAQGETSNYLMTWNFFNAAIRAVYRSASRTLCIPKFPLDNHESHILVTVSTGSYQPIPFRLKILVEDTLMILLKDQSNVTISPGSPTFVHFPLMNNTSQNVVVRVSSDNNHCMAVAIQEPICPVFDNKDSFGLESRWKMISQKGAIRVDMREYLKGFLIKVKLLQDDSLCGGASTDFAKLRQKSVQLVVENDLVISTSNGYFWIAVGVPPLVSLFIGIIFGGMYITSYSVTRNRMVSCRTQGTNKAENDLVSLQKFSNSGHGLPNYGKWTIFVSLLYAIPILDQSIYNATALRGSAIYGACRHNGLCSHSLGIFKNFNHLWSNVCYLVLGILFIFLTVIKKCVKEKLDGVPFHVGLYFSMGLALIVKGILSTAYHFCPNEANFQYDISYLSVVIAICFLKVFDLRRPQSISVDSSCGILAVWFLTSSLGIVFERYAWEWDEAFWIFKLVIASIQGLAVFYAAIYAIYIGYPIQRFPKLKKPEEMPLHHMIISELRQHPSQAPTSSQTKSEETDEDVYMRCYRDIPRCLWIFPKFWHWKLPVCRPERWTYVFLMLSLNGCLIYYSLEANYNIYGLIFLLSNFGLNFTYYFLMKGLLGEFGCSWKSIQVFVYLGCGLALGAFSAFYFIKNIEDWTKPGVSGGEGNEDCIWFQPYPFYDKHDAWHMLSAHALFFVFMTLLSIDDGVEGIDRDFLLVF